MRVCSPRNSGRCQATLRFAFAVVALLGWGSATVAQTGLGATVSFESASSWWGENAGSATIRVQLSAPVATTVTVSYATSNGSATSSQDYLSTTGTVQFAPGETIKEITIPILSDTTVEPTEDFQITLSNPSLGVTLGIHNPHTVNILDDDIESQLSLSATPTAVCAGAKSTTAHQATVTATVTDGSGAPQVGASVTFSTTSGSLNISSATTNASGQATVTLTSGTLANELPDMHNATVTATASTGATSSTTIEVQPPAALLSVATSSIETTQQSALTFNLSWNSAPVPQHTVSYRISRIWDGTNNLIYDGTGTPPSGYGSLQVGSSQTNSSGDATVTFSAGSNPGVIEIEGRDTDVELITSGDNPRASGFVMVLLPNTQPVTKVIIDNKSRGGDKVVVAKDIANGMPGGTKEYEVQVVPKGAMATLNIARTGAGSTAGSALFANGTTDLVVTGGDKPTIVTITGGDTSDKPQNMELQYKDGATVVESQKFTVFRVDLTAYTAGNSNEVIPAPAETPIGNLRALFDASKPNKKLGYELQAAAPNSGSYCGIYFRGKIVPAAVAKADFGVGRLNGFDCKRIAWNRIHKFFRLGPQSEFGYAHNQYDDSDDSDEDLTPSDDVNADTSLYIHAVDMPSMTSAGLGLGEVASWRFNATEWFNYGRVQCSNRMDWYAVFSVEKTAQGVWKQDDSYNVDGDNAVASGAKKPLSLNLKPQQGNPPTIIALVKPTVPAIVDRGKQNVAIEISGLNLKDGGVLGPHPARAVFLLQEQTATSDSVTRIEVLNEKVSADGKTFTGTTNVPMKKGKYILQVFGDGFPAAELHNALEVN